MTDPQVIINLGTGGSDLNGQNGSTSSADSNDARFLDWPGDNAGNYVYGPGVNSNYMLVPDEASFDVTDLDVRAYVAMDTWTPSGDVAIVRRTTFVDPNRAWGLRLRSSGVLNLIWYSDGTGSSVSSANSTVAVPFDDEESGWVRVTFDVDNGAGGYDIKFYTSDDGSTWSQLGSTVTGGATTSLPSVDSGITFADQWSVAFAGKAYRAQVMDAIDGNLILDIDTSVITSGSATSFTALTGQTVTINRSTSGRKSVAVVSPVWLFGTDDWMQVANNPLFNFSVSQSFTVLAMIRQWNNAASNGTYVATYDSVSGVGYIVGWQATSNNHRFVVADGTNVPQAVQSSAGNGVLQVIAGVRDVVADTITDFGNGSAGSPVTDTTTSDSSNSFPFYVGRRSNAAAFQDFEFIAAAVFRRALTQAEITSLTTYYQNRLS